MYVTVVYVDVKEAHVDDFKEACRLNHLSSVEEDGNMRFDILQLCDNPTQFVLYEAYESEAEAIAHKDTQHYLTWRKTVADWMASPRNGVVYEGLYPNGK